MASNKKYWKGLEELNENSSVVDSLNKKEFVEELPTAKFLGDKEKLDPSTSRRDFLKFVGFSTAAATLASCEGPVVKSIPYLVKPNDIIPGEANYYATTMADGFDFANVLVRVRDGRPIKIEPNKDAGGTTNARVQASLLSLYDSNRLKNPIYKGTEISWEEADKKIISQLNQIKEEGKKIALITGTHASPSLKKIIEEFKESYGNVSIVTYDAISESAALDAFEAVYGERALPNYKLENADVIVSVGADFLGDWQGGGFEKGYAKKRVPVKGKMSHHVQIEANMTLSGANSDVRIAGDSSIQKKYLWGIYKGIVKGESSSDKNIQTLVEKIKKAGENAIVLTGIQDKESQLIALAINKKIASSVIDVSNTKQIRKGNDNEVAALINDMNAGNVGALIINNINPIYTLPNASDFESGLKKVALTVSCSLHSDETAQVTDFVLAEPHYLESWGDAQVLKNQYSLQQPTIRPLFNTRQFGETLIKWLGKDKKYYEFVKTNWKENILDAKSWSEALHDGFYFKSANEEESQEAKEVVIDTYPTDENANGLTVTLYSKTGMGDGRMANNPWLQELPDPITRTTWDNYLTVSKHDAHQLGIKNEHEANGALNGSLVKISLNGIEMTVPALIQPGQARGTVGIALGYGRKKGVKEEMQTGVNAFSLYKDFSLIQTGASIEVTSEMHPFACTQLHNTLMGRGDIIKETTLAAFNSDSDPAHTWNKVPVVTLNHKEVEANKVDLWDAFDRTVGHHFNLSIDLNACTGCGSCVIACHAENNVPVVGKEEVRRSRDMHWLRIDRYYSHEETFEADVKAKEEKPLGYQKTMSALEDPSENPSVAFQPIMCQHCNHAPCETVCPVAATSHGRQGQNQMAYNRCIGTRYCANNCPYKVRRFNWFEYANNSEFNYHMNDDLGKMVLNPDVTVRSRGVMEKCSMCIQKTQATVLKAKKEGRSVNRDEFETACTSSCATGALVFGDINNKEDKITELVKDKRAYHLLEHVGTKPNVVYQVKVKNTK